MMQNVIRTVIFTMTVCFLGHAVDGFTVSPIQTLSLLPQHLLSRQQYPFSVREDSSCIVFSTFRTVSRTSPSAKKDSNDDTKSLNKMSSLTTFWKTLQEKPGGLILLPFVVLFGLDLLLNIIFLTKRSFEFFVLGQAPSQETWF